MNYIDQICERIVNPPKLRYSSYDLGPAITHHGKRHDFTLLNLNGLKIQASFYQPNQINTDICLIYLHSMNGSRLQSLSYVEEIMKMGIGFCSFDFSGCGNSEGNSISFGANQKNDVYIVAQHLKQQFRVQKLILWGRSMGSACAVKYCQMIQTKVRYLQHPVAIGMILDSCFSSFSKLAVEIGHRSSQMPQFLVKAGYFIIKGTLEQKGNFKVDDLQLRDIIESLNLPALFLTSRNDTVVSSEHSKSLYDVYSHPLKKLVYINGTHNQSRDTDYLREIKEFIKEAIQQNHNRRELDMLTDRRINRFEKNMFSNKNLVFEGKQHSDQTDGCYCSLIPSHNNYSPRNFKSQEALLTRRNTERPIADHKVRLRNESQHSPFSFKSMKQIPTKRKH